MFIFSERGTDSGCYRQYSFLFPYHNEVLWQIFIQSFIRFSSSLWQFLTQMLLFILIIWFLSKHDGFKMCLWNILLCLKRTENVCLQERQDESGDYHNEELFFFQSYQQKKCDQEKNILLAPSSIIWQPEVTFKNLMGKQITAKTEQKCKLWTV